MGSASPPSASFARFCLFAFRGGPRGPFSVDQFNAGPADLVVVAPLTTRNRGIARHVPIAPPEAGLDRASVVLCDHLRSFSRDRLTLPLGRVTPETLAEVEDRARVALARARGRAAPLGRPISPTKWGR